MRIVVDTGVFYHPEALARLAERPQDIVVPVVALAERLRQVRRDGLDVAAFRRTLVRAHVDVEAMGEPEATSVATAALDDDVWRKLSHDAFIAGHVQPGDELWTTNPEDFEALGVPRERIVRV
ncbi:MAG TPA: PIN domain-containing protein [Candidatus Thermoplasmatota archaeon]|nr:PIN domain-containing protein [Candidatus Thermoplasmatota archaeon]